MSNTPTPNNDAALSFLKRVHPEGPWALTCIATDRSGIETKTFMPGEEADLLSWLEMYNGKRNLYWHVNAVSRAMDKKAQREDIAEVRWLHVDIDPRAGEDIDTERKRALNMLYDPPGNVPVPTLIVFSGGGYQGFWQLDKPIEVNGELEAAEDAKRYNMQLEQVFGADNCHNIDRIMRLPGTINVPDERKIAKGRTPQLAVLVDDNERAYSLDQFVQARQVQTEDSLGFGGHTVQVSGNVPRLSDVQEIDKHAQEKVPDWCKALIVQGTDPDDPTKYPSRSEAIFAVACELVRRGVEDDIIYSVLTDPDFQISDGILCKGSSSEKYAIRQIERAREHAIDPWLVALNDKHAVISDMAGKCVIISEVYNENLKRDGISRQGFDHFKNRYMNQKVKVGQNKNGQDVYRPLGQWWLEHPQRRQYETLVFSPGQEVKDAYNLWRGWGVEARPGDCDLYLKHVYDNICGSVKEHYDYLIGWMARAVQKPNCPGETAIVLRGRQGTGKGIFSKCFGRLFGRHYLAVSDPKHLVGNFNAHLRDCVVLFGDEAFYAGDKKHEAVLKALVTEETIAIEMKGVDVEACPNYTHMILASNSHWVIPAGAEERRFFVLDVSDAQMQKGNYFGPLIAQMRAGGYEALLHYLLNYDISDFDVRKMPATKALQEQKELSYSTEEEWWFNKLKDGRLSSMHSDWQETIPRDVLQEDYILSTQKLGVNRRANQTALGRFLKRACPGDFPKTRQRNVEGKRPYYYLMPSLEACRKHWDERFGGPFEWPVIEDLDEADFVKIPLSANGSEPF